MSESTGVISRIDEEETEVELSAQELLELSDSRRMDKFETVSILKPSRPATQAPRASINPHVSASRLSLSLIAAVGLVGFVYVFTSSDGVDPSTTNTPPHTAQSEWSGPEQLAHGEPVRFANPFDADEVFEFPSGTTETDARDAVAELLLERAMSRQKT